MTKFKRMYRVKLTSKPICPKISVKIYSVATLWKYTEVYYPEKYSVGFWGSDRAHTMLVVDAINYL